MKIHILLLSLFSLSIYSAEAQKSFERGYIIKTASHDTIWGLINNKNWNSNPKIISFKLETGTEQKLGIYDIDEFGVISDKTTEVYRKKMLDLDKGRFELNELKNYPTPLIYRDTVFALLYESGRINFYYLRDETNRMHYLVEKNDTGILDLGIQRYIDADTRTLQSKDFYIAQLYTLMSDCADIITKISNLPFKEEELRKLVVYYNNSSAGGSGKKGKYTQRKEKVDFFVAALLGVGFRTDKISSAENYLLGGVSLGPSPNLDVAIALGVVMPRTNKHFEMGFELGWAYFRETKTYSQYSESVVLAPQMIRGNLLFRYLVPIKKVKLAFSSGLSMVGIVASVNQWNSGGYIQTAVPLTEWQLALIVGAGIRIRDFNIEARYFLNSNLAYIANSGPPSSHSLNLTVYYSFFNTEKTHTKAK